MTKQALEGRGREKRKPFRIPPLFRRQFVSSIFFFWQHSQPRSTTCASLCPIYILHVYAFLAVRESEERSRLYGYLAAALGAI